MYIYVKAMQSTCTFCLSKASISVLSLQLLLRSLIGRFPTYLPVIDKHIHQLLILILILILILDILLLAIINIPLISRCLSNHYQLSFYNIIIYSHIREMNKYIAPINVLVTKKVSIYI